ncbi:hypothetical protein THOG11_100123 [Vibrio harveyi]|nr:hypothetical protein THOG11_100123 [Vibrio harveyi]CAH1583460.1 hypothetical protein THOD03_80122 [Vibrio harveyi]
MTIMSYNKHGYIKNYNTIGYKKL